MRAAHGMYVCARIFVKAARFVKKNVSCFGVLRLVGGKGIILIEVAGRLSR